MKGHLSGMPDRTVIDGEIVATRRSGASIIQCAAELWLEEGGRIFYYVFDLDRGGDGRRNQIRKRLMSAANFSKARILPKLKEARPLFALELKKGRMVDLVQSVKAQGLEGLIAKRRNSRYEPGQRSGAWQKMWVNQGQEFVIGGYTIEARDIPDALVYGYYEGNDLIYAARDAMNGFTPKSSGPNS